MMQPLIYFKLILTLGIVLFSKIIKLNKTAFMLENGIWGKGDLCSQALITQMAPE